MEQRDKKARRGLLICNIALIVLMLIAVGLYSNHIHKAQEENKKENFIKTIESMKQISENYLDSERGYIKEWALYLSENHMTLEDALDVMRKINTKSDQFIHIVDMDTYEAYSSYYPKGQEKIDTYQEFLNENTGALLPFRAIMEQMFSETEERFALLGKYRLQETQSMGVGIGVPVTLSTQQGEKDYLMLRVVPIDVLKRSWVFPVEYSSAEVGIITNSGDYVIQSPSMKSQNFLEYIRGYNFQNDYNRTQELRRKLEETENGALMYKNFRGTNCLWYYSSFGEGSPLDILGVVNADELSSSSDAWYLVIFVCGILLLLMLLDGSYLVRMNRRLREAARAAEQASFAKTQFLSAMSHDIRTPLNAVLGVMAIAEKKAQNPAAVRECMDKGRRSGRQLLTLINDILDISKIESGKVTLNPETISLPDMMKSLTDMLTPGIKKKGITFLSDIHVQTHPYVYADGMRLNQIYMNLLSNSVKYTEEGGTIRLRLYEETVSERTSDIRLIFCLEDTGIGMTEEFQKNMYNAFTREVKTQVNRTQGTGLGLAIVKRMVDLMGGTITCRSIPGLGTSFAVSIELPYVEGGIDSKDEEEELLNLQEVHLLVAEDNDLNWEIFADLAADYGIVCDHAENGKECLERLLQAEPGTYTAVLMDVNMPVMDGYEATRQIRTLPDEEKSRIPIIAATADAFSEDVHACMECGMNGHIAKPIDMKKLMAYLIKIRKGQL